MKLIQKFTSKLNQNKPKDIIKNVTIESKKNNKIIDLNEYKKSKKLMKLFTVFLLVSALISPTKLSADGGETFVGRDRYETNFKTVQNIQNPEGIIVASGEDFPDSLSAISLVRVTNYPLVLTSKNGLNSDLRNYASQSSIKNIIVVGGKAKCNKFENKNYIYLRGRDRYETNKKVKEYVGKLDSESLGFPVVVDAKNYADSLSASNALLTQKGYLEFDPYSSEVVNSSNVYVIGGRIKNFSNKKHTTWIYGRDRYDTNSKVFDTFKYTFENPERCVLASGENFADSLSACNISLIKKCPIKLSRSVTSNNSEAYIVGGFGGRNVNHTTPKLKDETQLIVTKNKNEIEIKQVIKPKVEIGKYGDRGRLYLPSINASVALYNCTVDESNQGKAQRIVDGEDSAVVMEKWMGNGTVIGDHNNQAFKNLQRLSVGDVAYIDDKDGMTRYRCKEVDRNGLNLVSSLIDSNGDSAWDKYPLSLYTCNDALGKSVTIARFVLEKN